MSRPTARHASTLFEVMVSLALLSIVLTAIVANMSTLSQTRDWSAENEEANTVLRKVMEKIQSADMADLGASNHWSEAAWISDAAGNSLAGLDSDALVARGLIDSPTPLEDLAVYIEYFRGVDVIDNGLVLEQGMMMREEEMGDTDGDNLVGDGDLEPYRNRVNRTVLDGPNPFRLDASLPESTSLMPVGQQVNLDPAVVRVTLIWRADGRRIEAFTARRAEVTL